MVGSNFTVLSFFRAFLAVEREAACDDCLSGSTLMGSKLDTVCRFCSHPSALEIIYMQGRYSRAWLDDGESRIS
jgi:hypothetical protein